MGLGLAMVVASDAAADNVKVSDYTTTFDNIPAKWSQFYISEDTIEANKGEEVDKVYMTKLTYGNSGEATKLAGGHWFTVIGKNFVLLKDEDDITHLIETRKKCRSLKRAKYLVVGNKSVSNYYRRLGDLGFTTRFSEGFAGCQITGMYTWNGPTYYLDNIENPIHEYTDSRKRRDRSDPLLGRIGR